MLHKAKYWMTFLSFFSPWLEMCLQTNFNIRIMTFYSQMIVPQRLLVKMNYKLYWELQSRIGKRIYPNKILDLLGSAKLLCCANNGFNLHRICRTWGRMKRLKDESYINFYLAKLYAKIWSSSPNPSSPNVVVCPIQKKYC